MKWLGGLALVLLIVTGADAQVAITKCSGVLGPDGKIDPKREQCESIINSDRSLAPGAYTLTVISQDGAGNRSVPVVAGQVTILTPDATAPVVEDVVLEYITDRAWRVVYTCRDDVKCDGAEVTVTPAP